MGGGVEVGRVVEACNRNAARQRLGPATAPEPIARRGWLPCLARRVEELRD